MVVLVKLRNKHNTPAFKKLSIPEQLIKDLAGFHEQLRQTSKALTAQQKPLQHPSTALSAQQMTPSQLSSKLTGQQNPGLTV